MYGSIIGDIAGSIYEFDSIKTDKFILFEKYHGNSASYTDDSIHTVALADTLMNGGSYSDNLRIYSEKYPDRGYGSRFSDWVYSGSSQPYNSYGNGSAMRVSPVAWFYDSIDEVLEGAKESASVTHNHPEGIKGAQAVALAIFLARTGNNKDTIKKEIQKRFDYNLDKSLKEVIINCVFDETCQVSVPEALIAFLESKDYVDCIKKAISMGGDADTQAAIAGSIAEAYYGIPEWCVSKAKTILDEDLLEIVEKFNDKYVKTKHNF
jgi:ADP-ribosylglycohydrolase